VAGSPSPAADCNTNGTPDLCEPETRDIALFATQLLATAPDPVLACMFDFNADGAFNAGDMPLFIRNQFTTLLPALFSTSADVIDFNQVTAGTYGCDSQYAALAGDDVVTLPLNAAEALEAGYDPTRTFDAGPDNDTVIGGQLDDRIDGGSGLDNLAGGPGNDVYTVDAAGDVVTELAGEGVDTVLTTVSYTLNALPNIENITLLGSAGINATGNSQDNVLTGNAGNNILDGGAGGDTASFAAASAGVTVVLTTLSPQDTGGAGVDTLIGIEHLIGSPHADNLMGNSVNNVLDGGAGPDVLTGGAGIDTLRGGEGDDTLTYDAPDAAMDGGAGQDTVRAPGSGATLNTTAFIDIEVIDLTGTGNNTVSLTSTSVVNMSSTTDTLRVDGNAGDVVNLTGGGWSAGGTTIINSVTYNVFTKLGATVQVQSGVTANLL
jgi:Ca2+-binding RTX toxin-like protein